MKKVKSIHFVGIKGVGMAPLAVIAKEAKIKVTGSDVEEEFITYGPLKRAGITPYIGFDAEHVGKPDLVIASGANGGTQNIEVKEARKKGVKVIMQGQAVGEFMKGSLLGREFEGISVAGAHGKTTTTAMIATVLKDSGKDPSYVVGTGDIPSLSGPGHFGHGKHFVAEADEYITDPLYDKTVKFLWQHPKTMVFTNIEFDHPDVYESADDVRSAFIKFSHNLPSDGLLVVNGDDPQIQKILERHVGKVVTYGLSLKNDYFAKRISISGERMFFWVNAWGVELGEFGLRVVGEYNATNALAAIAVALELGVSIDKIKAGILSYKGSKRRSEYLGKLPSGALVFDDYAHHPTEIKKTLQAFKKVFPKERIVCIFQPHTYSRTKFLFEEFKTSFINANTVILTNIYASQREAPDPSISSELLAQAVAKDHRNVVFLPKLSDVVEYVLQKQYDKSSVLISMGAGDVYKIWSELKIEK
ncbi:MAG: UDP-N-acetylmuramate--L-alanine ligase [Candidatus Levybacteria bacterium]|nr:UDP-N-acetylmuramate--L-alanine ligase [Candidatus Levybacteria bacterium]